jgi:hypothetical protein
MLIDNHGVSSRNWNGTKLAERKKPSPPMTDEQIQKSIVGELKPFDSTITLAEYDRV